jgi:hypothetical protein
MRTFVLVPISALTAASGVAAAYDTARAQTALPHRYVPSINRGTALPAVKPILDGTTRAATINACAIKLS